MENHQPLFTSLFCAPAKRLLLSMFVWALVLPFTQAHGQVINVQFTDGSNLPVLNGESWTASVSPLAYTGTTWSQTYSYGAITETALPYSDSTVSHPDVSTVGFTLTGIGGYANNDTFQPLPMFYNTEYTGGEMTLTINGLQNDKKYALYLDAAFNGGDGSIIKVGTQTQDVSGATESSFISDANYAEFAAFPVDNSIVVTFTPDGTDQNLAVFNGFQIEAIPEPSSLALISMGAAALLLFAYRKRQLSL
jgi:hypothetical protein